MVCTLSSNLKSLGSTVISVFHRQGDSSMCGAIPRMEGIKLGISSVGIHWWPLKIPPFPS